MNDNLVARILCVDDEVEVLYALKRLLRSSDFIVDLASDPDQALDMVMHNSYDLIISDMRMPKLDGAELLAAAAKFSPSSRRVLLTGYSDQEATARAINQGKIHAYIEKPWDNRQFVDRITGLLDAKKRDDQRMHDVEVLKESYESIKARKLSLNDQVRRTNRQLEKTVAFLNVEQEELRSNFDVFLKIFSSTAMRHCAMPPSFMTNLQYHIESVADKLYMNDNQKQCVMQAAKLANIGKLMLPAEIVSIPTTNLSPAQIEQLKTYPRQSADMLMPIDALQETVVLIKYHCENYDGSGFPEGLAGHSIPLGSRLLRILIDFNVAISRGGAGGNLSLEQALNKLDEGSGTCYDPDLLEICLGVIQTKGVDANKAGIDLSQLAVGDALAEDAYSASGLLIAAAATHVTEGLVRRLRDIESIEGEKLYFVIK